MEILQDHINFCREVGAIAKKYKLRSFNGQFTPSWDDNNENINRVSFNWDEGRHGIDREEINIHAEVWVHTKVTEAKLGGER